MLTAVSIREWVSDATTVALVELTECGPRRDPGSLPPNGCSAPCPGSMPRRSPADHSGPAYAPAVSGNIALTILKAEMSAVASMCR